MAYFPKRVDRRSLLAWMLGASAGALSTGCVPTISRSPLKDWEQWQNAIELLPLSHRNLSVPQLTSSLRGLAAANKSFAKLTRIGTSRSGRPIEMLSIGKGPRSALIVGGSHGNEPSSCSAAEAFARLLCTNSGVREQGGYTWHIVASIDPDALELNSGWAEADPDLRSYLHGFFRPAFADQAEYTFPLQAGAYRWDRPTAENLAWRRALAITRPQLHYSMHGADYGGLFALTSARHSELSSALLSLSSKFDIPPNPVGEPFLEAPSYEPALFIFPDISRMAASSAEGLPSSWTAGDSSQGAASKMGAFSLTVEVPIWTDARVRDDRPSGFTLQDVMRHTAVWVEEDESLARALPPRGESDRSEAGRRLYLAATEDRLRLARQREALVAMLRSDRLPVKPLSTAEYLLHAVPLRILTLRTLALLVRASGGFQAGQSREAEAYLDRSLVSPLLAAGLRPVPLRSAIGAQLFAGLAAARALSADQSRLFG